MVSATESLGHLQWRRHPNLASSESGLIAESAAGIFSSQTPRVLSIAASKLERGLFTVTFNWSSFCLISVSLAY
ncbi:uncharacterized protein LAJ45_10427 [Morchella importuna]|uniref:uncharacterized protein n=1 Tax=Morchella importuna TaxID=1174673 RepID=UPI001E8EDC10|nr:uncharacterized protein LAJ45_10427 [Morchella importuna]KAH8145626.1 hypothetical protein LAJ45_10427 [Morchella importuna]